MGGDSATDLVRWLNDEQERRLGRNTKASRNRILDLLDTFNDTQEAIKSAPPDIDLLGFPPKRLSRLLAELDAKLTDYKTRPCAYIDCDRTLFIEYALAGGRCPGESLAADAVMQLAKWHVLDRVGKCICGKYFFANFRHQRSCSAVCRHKNYEQTEHFKNARREYMRNYYRLKKSGKVK